MLYRQIDWGKFFFKTFFILGLFVLEQASFVLSMAIIYGNRFLPLSVTHYIDCLPAIIGSSLILIDYYKLTHFQRKPLITDMYEVFKFVVIMIASTCIYAYVFNLYALSRFVLLLGSAFCYVSVIIWIGINKRISFRLYDRGKLLIVARDRQDATDIVLKITATLRHLNLESAGWVTPADLSDPCSPFDSATDILVSDAVGMQEKYGILELCSERSKSVYVVPTFNDLLFSKHKIVKFEDMPTFAVENRGLTFQQQLLKRAFDIVFSLFVVVLTSPLWLLIALLIKLDSSGPVFYTQERVTFNGRAYKALKFRSMVADAEKIYGAYQSLQNDERVTRVGRLLRQTHLDELPQFLNVILGSMSVVGPRSDRTMTIDFIEKNTVGYSYRLKVKSGITGLAQLFGRYNSDPKDKLRYDVYYIKNYSLALDLQLIFLTIGAMIPKAGQPDACKTNFDYYAGSVGKSE